MADWNPTNAAEIIDDFNNNAQDGDTIFLPSGTFDCSGTDLITTEAFNVVGPGSGNCTVLCNVDFQPATAGQNVSWSGVTLDGTNSAPVVDAFGVSGFYFNKANYVFEDIVFVGPNTSGTDALVNIRAHDTNIVRAIFIKCRFDGSNGDLLVTKGGASTATNLDSWVRCYQCDAVDRGGGSSDQCYSAHDGVRMDLFECTYVNSDLSIDNRSSIAPGASPLGGQTMMTLINCDIVGRVSVARMLGGRIRCSNGSALEPKLQTGYGDFLFAGIHIIQTSGTTRGIECNSSYSGRIESCLVETGSGNNAIYLSAPGRVEVTNCRLTGMTNPVSTASGAAGSVIVRNTICEGTVRANFQNAGATTTWDWDYNRISGTGNHITGTHDFTAAAQLNANGTPTVGGNCYRTGDSVMRYFYHLDLAGRNREPFPQYRSIGPIEPPRPTAIEIQPTSLGVAE